MLFQNGSNSLVKLYRVMLSDSPMIWISGYGHGTTEFIPDFCSDDLNDVLPNHVDVDNFFITFWIYVSITSFNLSLWHFDTAFECWWF